MHARVLISLLAGQTDTATGSLVHRSCRRGSMTVVLSQQIASVGSRAPPGRPQAATRNFTVLGGSTRPYIINLDVAAWRISYTCVAD